ncbi:MAG: GNAT family N-acetyltransferase [Hyphomicrobiaceae bacterium]
MAEVSVYVTVNAQGKGIGSALIERLIEVSEAEGYWTLQAQILAANEGSRALHRRCGFREVGYRERFGHIKDCWHDIVLMERRSARAGGPGLPTRSCDD